jgi:hypothetical protein
MDIKNSTTSLLETQSFLQTQLFILFFAVLGLEIRAYTLSHCTTPFFVMGFLMIGSHKLFAQAGFGPRSS